MKTSVPDFVSDFQIQFEEWVMSIHEDLCTCQACDPEMHMELLEAITDFDCDPMGSLEEAMLYHKDEPDDYDGGRFDYLTSRGV